MLFLDLKIVRCQFLGSPKLGASFVDYIITMHEGGKNSEGFCGQADVESFVYILGGKVKVTAGEQEFVLEESGYVYCPPGTKMYLENLEASDSRFSFINKSINRLKDVSHG